MNYIAILSTAPSQKEAAKIARALVSKRLAACVNIIPKIRSIYKWKGRLYDEGEAMMVMKSRKALFSKIKKEFKKLHPYECPELIAVFISNGSNDYLKWLCDSTIAPATKSLAGRR